VPLGFGVTSRSSQEAKKLEGTGVVVFRQADTGEYLREVCALDFVFFGPNLLTLNRRILCSQPKHIELYIFVPSKRRLGVSFDQFDVKKSWPLSSTLGYCGRRFDVMN